MMGLLQSCSEYLEEANPNEISSDSYWTNLEQSGNNLTSVYGAMLNHNVVAIAEESWGSDLGVENGRADAFPWYRKIFDPNLSTISNRWNAMYRVIWRANQVIDGLNGMSSSLKADPQWTEQMAQARFFRGLMHFYLHSKFNEGNVIIHDKVAGNVNELYKSLSPASEVLAFFRQDLEYAYTNLPAKFPEKTRVTAGLAATILGTSYLYEEDYDTAITYFNDVINNSDYGYELMQDVSTMWTNEGEFNSESIFEINYSVGLELEGSQWDESSFSNRLARITGPSGGKLGATGWLHAPAWLIYEYTNEPLDSQDPRNYVPDGNGGIRLRSVSLRAAQSIAIVNDLESTYYGETVAQAYQFPGVIKGIYKKHTNHSVTISENIVGGTSWKSGRSVVVNRLADVYLMYAECLIQKGNITEALSYINDVRKRWGLQLLGPSDGSAHDFDEINYDANTLMNHLMYKERPLELALEGFSIRSNDLRRWGISKARYQELGAELYYKVDFDYELPNGDTATASGALLQKGASPDPDVFEEILQFRDAAQFFIEGKDDYLPIPSSETLNNPNI